MVRKPYLIAVVWLALTASYAGWLSISPLAALPGPTLVTLYGSIGMAVAIACAYLMGAPETQPYGSGAVAGLRAW